jgi:2'-5' RNA ligase
VGTVKWLDAAGASAADATTVRSMSVGGGRSGIVVPVPEAEELVGPWRADHDRSARHGVPAHITVLFPFRPAAVVDGTVAELAEIVATVRPQPFRLTHVAVFPMVTWLAPEPASIFRDLTLAMVDHFPDCLPYGGTFGSEPVPHLTVLDHSSDHRDGSAAHAEFVTRASSQLPIVCELREVRLLVEDVAGDWTTHTSFPLG